MKIRILFSFILILLIFGACTDQQSATDSESDVVPKVYTRFRGDYKTFNDLHDLHIGSALQKGISPMQMRDDTVKHLDKLIRLPEELDLYRMHNLTHSIPYLVEDASKLLLQISSNFRDSLVRKKLPVYKLVVTSVTRTLDDVSSLTKRNLNASHNSAHCYATTFDISWKRFDKRGPKGANDVSVDRLKLILAEVLHDLRQRDLCYVVHERKQACFHITAR